MDWPSRTLNPGCPSETTTPEQEGSHIGQRRNAEDARTWTGAEEGTTARGGALLVASAYKAVLASSLSCSRSSAHSKSESDAGLGLR